MLSITGMTLEQFAGLMVGLGYKAKKGSRLKAVSEDHTDPKTQINQITLEEAGDDPDVNLKEVIINETNADTALDMHEEFYTFFWIPKKMNKIPHTIFFCFHQKDKTFLHTELVSE